MANQQPVKEPGLISDLWGMFHDLIKGSRNITQSYELSTRVLKGNVELWSIDMSQELENKKKILPPTKVATTVTTT
jgi:hypothetical protein